MLPVTLKRSVASDTTCEMTPHISVVHAADLRTEMCRYPATRRSHDTGHFSKPTEARAGVSAFFKTWASQARSTNAPTEVLSHQDADGAVRVAMAAFADGLVCDGSGDLPYVHRRLLTRDV
jgi:hypothetical protein